MTWNSLADINHGDETLASIQIDGALGWHEWLVKRIGSLDCDASIARFIDTSTIMMRCWLAARRRASAIVIDSPRISPIFSRGGTASAANTPKPSMAQP